MRISRQQMFMEMAHVVAKRSVCMRLNVGALIIDNNNVVAIGYNGPASGQTHCEEIGCEVAGTGGCSRSIHAERNALNRIPPECVHHDLRLYVTHSPCLACAELILKTKVSKVYFQIPYRNEYPISLLTTRGIEVYQCAPNGHINKL